MPDPRGLGSLHFFPWNSFSLGSPPLPQGARCQRRPHSLSSLLAQSPVSTEGAGRLASSTALAPGRAVGHTVSGLTRSSEVSQSTAGPAWPTQRPHLSSRPLKRLLWILPSVVVGACALTPVEGELSDPGTPAKIVFSMSGGLAGLADTTVIDSASALLVRTLCLSIRGVAESCPSGRREWRVQLSRATADSLFATTQSAAFRALAPEYDMSGTFVDGPAYGLRITLGARTRGIRWSDAPGVPPILASFAASIRSRAP